MTNNFLYPYISTITTSFISILKLKIMKAYNTIKALDNKSISLCSCAKRNDDRLNNMNSCIHNGQNIKSVLQ